MHIPLAITWGPGEILIVLLVMLLLFGGKRLPGLARSLGSSVTEFKKGIRGGPTTQETDETKEGEAKLEGDAAQKRKVESDSDAS